VATRLLDMGLERVQYSVFVGPLSEERRQDLEEWVTKKFENHNNANFLILPLHQYSIDEGGHIGTDPPDWEYLTGQKPVLIL
jgi:CRISPR-associated endonuclease Cas2